MLTLASVAWVCRLSVCAQTAPLPIEQDYTIRRWGMEDGLPEGVITSIQQFPDGFLWLTTPRHVVRFDGVDFLSWQPGEEPSCTLRRLRGLMQDSSGALWLYAENGVMRMEGAVWKTVELKTDLSFPSNTVWTVDTSDGELQQKPHVEVFWVEEGPDSTVWAATSVGVFRFHDGAFVHVKPDGLLSDIPFSSAALDAGGIFWLAGRSGLVRFDGRSYSPASFPAAGGRGVLLQVFKGAGEQLWGKRVDGKLFQRLQPDGEWTERPPQGLRLTALLERGDEIWMGAAEGFFRWKSGTCHVLSATGSDSATDIRCLKENQDGLLWVGTGNGLLQLRPRTVQLLALPGDPKCPVTALLPSEDGTLWLGTGKGVRKGSVWASQARFTDHPVLKTVEVSALSASDKGGLLIGTRGDHVWSAETNGVIRQLRTREGHSSRSVTCLLEGDAGRLWIGTREGLLYSPWSRWAEASPEGPEYAVSALCRGGPEDYWVGTQGSGLWQLSGAGQVRRTFRVADGLPSDTVRVLQRETNGVVWVGTSSGLARLGPARAGVAAVARSEGAEMFAYTTEHGLPGNDIRQVLDDGQGNLWLGIRQEICRVDKRELLDVAHGRKDTLGLRVFGEADGLSAELMGAGGPLTARLPAGQLLFATKAGVAVIEPAKLGAPPPPSRVYVEGVNAMARSGKEASVTGPSKTRTHDRPASGLLLRSFISKGGGVRRFPAGTRGLVFGYTMPEHHTPERVRYRTLLEGCDKTWSEMTGERSATFTRLASGAYTFRVMASRAGGGWVEAARPLSVEIAPFFWETGWFKLLVALLALGGVGLASGGLVRRRARIRLERVRRAAEERERVLEYERIVERERARIARDIHDDLGAGLTEIGVLGDLATDTAVKEPDRVTRIREMAEKARRMVDTLDEIVWTVNPRNDTLQSFLYYAADYTRDFLRPADLRCRLDLPESVPEIHLGPDRRHALLMVLKEALNNMVKHANASEALLRIRLDGEVLRMQITDNGKGFATGSERREANGLRGMRERLESVHGCFTVESRPGAGTTLTVEMTF